MRVSPFIKKKLCVQYSSLRNFTPRNDRVKLCISKQRSRQEEHVSTSNFGEALNVTGGRLQISVTG